MGRRPTTAEADMHTITPDTKRHCCTCCTCSTRRWNLRPDLRPAEFDDLVAQGDVVADALAIPLRSVAS